MVFYPEETTGTVYAAYQADKWLREIDPRILTPMYRHPTLGDFFNFEPTLISGGIVCMPFRWFTRLENGSQEIHGKAWVMREEERGGIIKWAIWRDNVIEISSRLCVMSFVELTKHHHYRRVLDPALIWGMFISLLMPHTSLTWSQGFALKRKQNLNPAKMILSLGRRRCPTPGERQRTGRWSCALWHGYGVTIPLATVRNVGTNSTRLPGVRQIYLRRRQCVSTTRISSGPRTSHLRSKCWMVLWSNLSMAYSATRPNRLTNPQG